MLQLRERDDLDIVGIVMETGSATSHSAILAASLGIPTLVGVANAIERIGTGHEILVDADAGIVNLAPSDEAKKSAARAMRARRQRNRQLVKLRGEDAVTLDGEALELLANIALPDDLPGPPASVFSERNFCSSIEKTCRAKKNRWRHTRK